MQLDLGMRSGHIFWLWGPIDTRSMHLNYILQDLFRDNPFDHIWRAHCPSMHPKYCIYPIRPYLGMYLRNCSHHYTCRWYVPFQGVGMSGEEPVVSRHCPPCLSWRGDPSAHKWGRSPNRPPPLFCSLMDFYDPNDFDDPQASNDPKGISISSLIIQKPAVVPPSSMVLFLLMSTQV